MLQVIDNMAYIAKLKISLILLCVQLQTQIIWTNMILWYNYLRKIESIKFDRGSLGESMNNQNIHASVWI